MEVCRMRDTPVIVFINKMDRDGKNRFDLLEEIEKELGIGLHPMTWPINSGKEFKGVYNLHDKNLLLICYSVTQSIYLFCTKDGSLLLIYVWLFKIVL